MKEFRIKGITIIKTYEKWFLAGVSFIFLFLVCIYKLTHASLWFDETTEFYYSKSLLGVLPWQSEVSSMYERIVSTFQPPLYNFIMFFWLKISESEWWFRFFGVVMGIIGAVGIYKSVEKVWNYRAAAISVIILACTKQYIYYVQECAEYNLMLAGCCWLMYAWICLMEKVTPKRIFGFLLAAIISVYSQYGAVFPVAAFSITAFINVLYKREKKEIQQILAGYGLAVVLAAIPLWIFFMGRQLESQQLSTSHVFSVNRGLLLDICIAFKTVVGWCFRYNTIAVLAVIVVLCMTVLIFSKKIWIKWLIIANGICWIIYYIAVKLSFYSYGSFGNRYNLFFIPVWLTSFFFVVYEVKEIAAGIVKNKGGGKNLCRAIRGCRIFLYGICFAAVLVFCLNGFHMIKLNWDKEDIRGAVDKWYEADGYHVSTFIYYASSSGFSYYCEHNREYDPSNFDNVVFMKFDRGKSVEEYSEYLNGIYNNIWPENLYVIASHTRSDLNTILQCFTDRGYDLKDVYNKNDGKLFYLTVQKE